MESHREATAVELALDVACPACEGSGKNTQPGAEHIGEEGFRKRRRAERFLLAPPVAARITEIAEEWEELKRYAAERGDDEVLGFVDYLQLREGDSVITRAYVTANTNPDCEPCKGKGRELTEEGKKLLAFIKRWPPED
ncbi:hypothetical protein [Allokutzneria oryzae]|uniref:Uncharacterized protein n=1 Tax=Allokutzneria oryzae TaxID=1378989 RepID=A0ABV6A4D3_9PSEU